jgi:4-amino-4-deoxy-L-arabinose transferase-like glycosyltransferase
MSLFLQFDGPQSVIGTDGVEYVTSGVNLIGRGAYVNSTGESEIWVPPLYPALIGVLSGAGAIDPFLVARMIAACFGVLMVWVTTEIGIWSAGGRLLAGTFAGLLVALNPVAQRASSSALSEAVAAALVVMAFWWWLVPGKSMPAGRCLRIGFFAGAAYLTRPEWVVLLPCLIAVDLISTRHWRVPKEWVWSVAVFAAMALPALAWVTHASSAAASPEAADLVKASTRGQIVLASGRASYYGVPRERMDSASGELRISNFSPTLWQEARRSLWNLGRIVKGYADALGGWLSAFVATAAVLGALSLARHRQIRTLLGLGSLLIYLPVLVVLDFKARYLTASLPAIAVLTAIGLINALATIRRATPGTTTTKRLAAAFLVGGVGLAGCMAGSTNLLQERGPGPRELHRQAGWQLKALNLPAGILYEPWLEAGYYGGQQAHLLTRDPIATVLAYIERREPADRPVRILISSLAGHLDDSVKMLLKQPQPGMTLLVRVEDPRGVVVIYQLERRREPRPQASPGLP